MFNEDIRRMFSFVDKLHETVIPFSRPLESWSFELDGDLSYWNSFTNLELSGMSAKCVTHHISLRTLCPSSISTLTETHCLIRKHILRSFLSHLSSGSLPFPFEWPTELNPKFRNSIASQILSHIHSEQNEQRCWIVFPCSLKIAHKPLSESLAWWHILAELPSPILSNLPILNGIVSCSCFEQKTKR
jgi:hypothetical protein